MNTENKLAGTSFITALTASLCCISPLLALVAGSSGLASAFSWLDPFRPFFIASTVVVLAYAWYLKLKGPASTACPCEADNKPGLMQTKSFLGLVTAFAFLMLAFPNYAQVFYPAPSRQSASALPQEKVKSQTVEFKISGMSCDACTLHVAKEVNKVAGILHLQVSYAQANARVQFDKSKTSVEQVQKAIQATGYKVTATTIRQ